MSRRTLRMNELIRQELSLLIQRKVKDPRLNHLLSITNVSVTSDLKEARVLVSAMGTDEDKREITEGLRAAAPFLRKSLASTLTLRYIPRLVFSMDDSLERGDRIGRIITELNQSTTNSNTL